MASVKTGRCGDAMSPRFGGNEQIVEQIGTHRAHGRKQRVKLRKADAARTVYRDQYHRFVSRKSLSQKGMRTREIHRLPVELPIGIEQEREVVEIIDGGLADVGRHQS